MRIRSEVPISAPRIRDPAIKRNRGVLFLCCRVFYGQDIRSGNAAVVGTSNAPIWDPARDLVICDSEKTALGVLSTPGGRKNVEVETAPLSGCRSVYRDHLFGA